MDFHRFIRVTRNGEVLDEKDKTVLQRIESTPLAMKPKDDPTSSLTFRLTSTLFFTQTCYDTKNTKEHMCVVALTSGTAGRRGRKVLARRRRLPRVGSSIRRHHSLVAATGRRGGGGAGGDCVCPSPPLARDTPPVPLSSLSPSHTKNTAAVRKTSNMKHLCFYFFLTRQERKSALTLQ